MTDTPQGAARPPPQDAEAADLHCASTTRSPGSAPRKASILHVRYAVVDSRELELIDRERRMVDAAASRRRRDPRGQEPRQLRLQGHPLAQQGAGPGAGPLRVHRVFSREPHERSGNSGTGKTHIALGLGLAACQKQPLGPASSPPPRWSTNSSRPAMTSSSLRFQKKLATYKLPVIVDELGFVAAVEDRTPSSLFEVFSQRYERGSYPGHHQSALRRMESRCSALEHPSPVSRHPRSSCRPTTSTSSSMTLGDSYRLNQSRRRQTPTAN